ncbi:interleukin-27 receptor subunit alpha [Sorex araneus]|uniref:interleukin-27 receptor subunit alpha n=1 Tax=Sorex araneus TaxID=42254 RepID=UPI0003317D43|nr:interleukin-27 receptor subunit alpha [Sorex araneus]
MWGAPGDPCRPLALLPVLWLLTRAARPHDSPDPLQCYCVGPRGNLNCSWGLLGDQEEPSTLHLESRKYHPNKTWTVAVPPGQGWVTLAREYLTESDQLLVWGAMGSRRLWPPVLVNLESRMKPDAPVLDSAVDFPEEAPGEARITWHLPAWPRHKRLVCRFHYRRGQEATWTQLDLDPASTALSPLELQDLQPVTTYEVRGQCRMETEEDLWGELSPILSFQTLPPAPEEVWILGHGCGSLGAQDPMLLWKAPESSMQTSYTVWYQVEGKLLSRSGVPCCRAPIPTTATSAGVSVSNGVTSPEFRANLSLGCSALGSAPHDVAVHVARGSGLLVTWRRGSEAAWEYVVDWVPDTDTPGELSWVRLPPDDLSALLPGHFEGGVPYRVTVTAVSLRGLAPAPSVWAFTEELAPLKGPTLQRLQDAPPTAPTIAWDELPRHQLRGHLTHYTLCTRTGTDAPACSNVSGSTRSLPLPSLPWGPCELWMTASTRAGQGPPGPSLRFYLPENVPTWKVVFVLLASCCVFVLGLVFCRRYSHRVWEKTPDPANSSFYLRQPHVQELPYAQPPGDLPFLQVEEMEPVAPPDPPKASSLLDTGYEKHFLPTPEALGLLPPCSPGPRAEPEPAPPREKDAQWTDEDAEDQRN